MVREAWAEEAPQDGHNQEEGRGKVLRKASEEGTPLIPKLVLTS
jgi:hypothetical protein